MPPSHAGMVPAALPAFSPPSGVSVVPSLFRSAAESSAAAGVANAAATASAARDFGCLANMVLLLWVFSNLERIAHAEREEVAILQRVGRRAERGGLRGRHAVRDGVGAAIEAPTAERGVLRVHDPFA